MSLSLSLSLSSESDCPWCDNNTYTPPLFSNPKMNSTHLPLPAQLELESLGLIRGIAPPVGELGLPN